MTENTTAIAHDYDNRGPQLLSVNIAFGIVSVIAVLLRTYTRVFIVKALGPDDWLMAVATVVWIAYCVSSSTGVYYGTGQHMYNLEPENMEKALYYWWLCYLLYSVIAINIKASFAWFLLRIITNQVHKWVIYTATLFSVIPRVAFFFVALFQCQPVSYFWDRSQPGKCIPINIIVSLVYFDSVMTIITDFTFAILPAFIIWSLKMKTRVKALLVFLIAMGCIASAAVCVRLAYTHTIMNPDFLWATTDVAIWPTIELGLAISAASLVTLRPLLNQISWKLGVGSEQRSSPSRVYKLPSNHKINGGSHLDRNVYIMSEFSQGRSFAKKGGEDSELGTHTAAYAGPGKNLSTESTKEINFDNESQERLHNGMSTIR